MNLGSLTELATPFGARAAAPALLADQALRYSRLALPIVVGDVVGLVTAVPINFPRIIASAAAVIGLNLIAFAQAAPAARRPRPGPGPVLLADQALGDARLPLSVVVPMGTSTGETPPSIRDAVSARNVVGIVSAVPINLARVELAPAAIIRLDLVALS